MSRDPILHATVVDGIHCFWVDTQRPTLRASLVFRHGMADEPVTQSGWQHLIEHLCLEDNPGHGGLDMNGSVSLHETTFDAHGEPEAVVTHLTNVVRWLAQPRFDRLAHEQQVLRAEAAVRGRGPVANALAWRYGARGPGLASLAEPGLGRATASGLSERIRDVFTADNAALILDGPPPATLRLDLPNGSLAPLPPAVQVDTGPAAYYSEGLTFSGVVPRDSGMFVGVNLLERALRERLREEAGGAYAPWTDYTRVDANSAMVTAGSDLQPDLVDSAVATVRGIVEEFATAGPPDAWVTEEIVRSVRQMSDPYATVGLAYSAAQRHLHGRPILSFEESMAELRAVDVDQVRTGMESLRDSLLIGAVPAALTNEFLPMLHFPPSVPQPGAVEVRSINWPANTERLRLHRERIEISSDEQTLAVGFEDLAAYLVYEDGLRHLLRHDGYGLSVDPRLWVDGDEAVAFVDSRVPDELHLPQPAVDRAPVERLSAWTRWAGTYLDDSQHPWLAVVGLTVLAFLIMLALRLLGGGENLSSALGKSAAFAVVFVGVGTWWTRRKARSAGSVRG